MQVHEALKNWLNTPLIVLLKDANCEDGFYYQLGNSCVPAYLSADFSTGTTIDGQKGYLIKVMWYNTYVLTYTANINLLPVTTPSNLFALVTNILAQPVTYPCSLVQNGVWLGLISNNNDVINLLAMAGIVVTDTGTQGVFNKISGDTTGVVAAMVELNEDGLPNYDETNNLIYNETDF
jgi:hypothetical protein